MPETPMSPLSPPEKDGKQWIEPDMGLLEGFMKTFYYGTPNGYIVQLTYDMENRDKKPILSVIRIDGFLETKQYDEVISFERTTEVEGQTTKITESAFDIDDLSKANEFVDKAKALPKAKEKLSPGDRWVNGLYPPMLFQ